MFKSKGFKTLLNTYSAAPVTKASLNLVLTQSMRLYNQTKIFLDGSAENITYEIFRNNDYKIQFIYQFDYLGYDKGLIDYYYPTRQPMDVCRHSTPNFLFGFCSERFLDVMVDLGLQQRYDPQIERLKTRIAAANAADAGNWLTYSYVYFPGHTDVKSSWKDAEYMTAYRKDYKAKLGLLSDYMADLTDHILRLDNDPIIVFFGDHGAWHQTKPFFGQRIEFLLHGGSAGRRQKFVMIGVRWCRGLCQEDRHLSAARRRSRQNPIPLGRRLIQFLLHCRRFGCS